jgi:hypothetical protein
MTLTRVPGGTPTFLISSDNSCLYHNADGRQGTYYCNEAWNDQHWRFVKKNANSYMLQNVNSGECLYSNSDGRTGIYYCNDAWIDQFWSVE